MIDLLVKYANEKGVPVEPGFGIIDRVMWLVNFTVDGAYDNVYPLGDDSLGKKNAGLTFTFCPEFMKQEVAAMKPAGSQFLIESASTVALYDVKPDDLKGRQKHCAFTNLLVEASAVMPVLRTIADGLNDEHTLSRICAELKRSKAQATTKVTIGIALRPIVEGDDWHTWWRAKRQAISHSHPGASPKAQILLGFESGSVVEPAITHPSVRYLGDVGGMDVGTSVVGFDKPAFTSFGLTKSANAAMSEEAAWAYRNALNHLLARSERLAGARVAYWYGKARELAPKEDPIACLLDPTRVGLASTQEQDAAIARTGRFLRSAREGMHHGLADAEFCALTLSGAGGRVMVRDWMAGRFEDLAASVDDWFDDLNIVNYSGGRLAKLPRLGQLISCVLPPRKDRQDYDNWIAPASAGRIAMWRSAVTPRQPGGSAMPIPFGVVSRAVISHSNFMGSAAIEDALRNDRDKAGRPIALLQARMALFKAYWRREGDTHMTCFLNEEHPAAAYHCGRLMAMYARLQKAAAKRELNADVVQRFYAAASKTPALVLGRLATLSKFHLNQIDNPKLSGWFEQRIAEIACQIDDAIPNTLTLKEQSLFALGYYHQYAHRYKADPLGPTEDDIEESEGDDNV